MKILIPAAGKGSRFQGSKYHLPKPMISVDGEPMLIRAAKTLGFRGEFIFIIQESEYRVELATKLKEAFSNCKIAVIGFDTDGPVETSLIAEEIIDSEEELLIANCDQILSWDHGYNSDTVLKQLRKYDAGVLTINSTDPKHSYARIENNLVVEIQEKKVISEEALVGIHYWKHGCDFIKSAREMISDDQRTNNEFYIGPTYNYLIKDGKKVTFVRLNDKDISFVGTPEDLQTYESNQTV